MRLNAAQGAQELWKLRDQFKPVETPIWNSVDEMHRHIVTKFVATPGMGSGRLGPMLMEIDAEKQLLITRTGAAGGKSFAMTKLELIGIARHEQPVAFERIAHGSDRWITRELGEFETSALAELNAGKNTVTRENSGGMFVVGAIRADAACVSCHRTYKEGSLLGAFSYALSPSQAPAPQQRVDALLSRVGSGNPLQSAELDELRSLLADPEASKAITLDQVLATFQRAQANDAVAQISGIGLHWQLSKRWPNDPKIVAFYHEALTVRGPAAIQDLWGTAGTPWDASFIEPVIRTMEDSVRKIPASGRGANGIWLVVDRGLGLLDRHYESWRNDASIPPRLSNVARQVIPIEVNGFYNTTRHLAETRDRAMIAVLRQSLTDKTIDRFTSASSNMPLGVTPMRNCDLAANAILRLLGEPEMVSPFRRAQAPRGGPFPEWDEWDKKIAALQQRLDQLTPR
jgi:hypothetical protein